MINSVKDAACEYTDKTDRDKFISHAEKLDLEKAFIMGVLWTTNQIGERLLFYNSGQKMEDRENE